MRAQDVSAFTSARWPALVRVLVLMGAPGSAARGLAARACGGFARAHRRRDDDSGDPDVQLFAALLALLDEPERAEPWWRGAGGSLLDELGGPGLEAQLDTMTPRERAGLALVAAGRLDDVQVAELTGADPATDRGDLPRRLAALATAVEVGPPAASAPARRPRVAVVVAALALAGLLVVAGVSLLGGAPGPTTPPAPTPSADEGGAALPAIVASRATDDDVPVVWYGAGELRLPGRALEVPDVTDLAALRGGAVVARADAGLTFVASDGATVPIGRRAPGTGFAVAEPDLVAYRDATARPRVVVERFDPESRPSSLSTVLDLGVSADTEVVGLDQDAVVLAAPGRRWRVDLESRDATTVAALAQAGGTNVRSVARERVEVRSGSTRVVVRGADATVSDDGRYVMVRRVDDTADGAALYLVVDARRARPVSLPVGVRSYDLATSGEVLVPTGNLARDAALADGGRAVFVVDFESGRPDQEDGPEPQYNVVVCRLAGATCRPETATAGAVDPPLLAH